LKKRANPQLKGGIREYNSKLPFFAGLDIARFPLNKLRQI
jgi:hypothetical protein